MAQDATMLDDPKRLGVLRSYEILDTPPEPAFDRLAKLAAQVCGAPYAVIVFLDGSRQFVKSKIGFTYADAPDQPVFCCQAVHQSGLFIVPDATHDERFATDPLVTGVAQVRFYAGMPLVDCYHTRPILAYELNSAPTRLRFESQFGYKQAKYVTMVELVETLSGTGGGKGGYWEDDQGYE